VFFLSADDALLVKTIRKTEFVLLRRILPRYYQHMLSHPNSLLVRVLGLYSITAASSGGRKVGGAGAAVGGPPRARVSGASSAFALLRRRPLAIFRDCVRCGAVDLEPWALFDLEG
jgi:hypothetical protein